MNKVIPVFLTFHINSMFHCFQIWHFFFAPSLKNFTSDIFHDNIINNAVITKMHAID